MKRIRTGPKCPNPLNNSTLLKTMPQAAGKKSEEKKEILRLILISTSAKNINVSLSPGEISIANDHIMLKATRVTRVTL